MPKNTRRVPARRPLPNASDQRARLALLLAAFVAIVVLAVLSHTTGLRFLIGSAPAGQTGPVTDSPNNSSLKNPGHGQ